MNDVSHAFQIAVRRIGPDDVLSISGRELHAYLRNRDKFATWIKDRVEQYGFTDGQDFETFSESSEKGRPRTEYAVTIDMAKELAMVERTVQGRIARRYFIDCERQLRERLAHEAAVSILLLPAPREWKKRFEPPYYQSLARLMGLSYTGHASGTPVVFGKITDEWVYQVVLPTEVLTDMRERRENSQKLHQCLTDGGLQKLERQILRVMDVADTSSGYQDFKARCMRLFQKPGQLGLIYPTAA